MKSIRDLRLRPGSGPRPGSTRGLRPNGSALGLIGGYGGSLALVLAAVAVLAMPLLRDDGNVGDDRAAAVRTPGGTAPAQPAASMPAQPGPGERVSAGPRQGQGSAPRNQGGGPPMPGRDGGGTLTWCPDGTAFYRDAGTGLQVTINVSASGLVRAEAALRGRSSVSRQDSVRRPGPHTLRFAGVTGRMVERVKVTTVSVGVAVQTCYARPGT